MKTEQEKKDFFDALEETSKMFKEAMDSIEKEQEEFWNSLSKEDQLKCFCAVVRRIYDGELKDQCSYRGMLYSKFGFGMESYVQAQVAGYLEIHNILFDAREKQEDLTNNQE